MDMVTAAILAQLGMSLFDQLGGFFGRPSGAEAEAQRTAGIGGTLIPQLQAQAAGQPTAATEAQISRMGEDITRAQQAYATSAQRGGIAGTTPARVQIGGRLEAARQRGIADIMGRGMLGAQQQLGGLYGAGVQTLERMELQQQMRRQQLGQDIGAVIGMYKAGQTTPRFNALYEQIMRWLQGELMPVPPAFAAGGAGAGAAPGWRPPPGFFTPGGATTL